KPLDDPDFFRESLEKIWFGSQLLGEVFAHAAAVCRGDLGAEALMRAGVKLKKSMLPKPCGDASLEDLAQEHRERVQTIIGQAMSHCPDSKIISSEAKRFEPVDLLVWAAVRDHPGARVINDVWFPKEAADTMMNALAIAQAQAMRPG